MKKILLSAVALMGLTAATAQIYSANDSTAFAAWTNVDMDGDGMGWTAADLSGGANTLYNEQGGCAVSYSYDNSTGPLTPDNVFASPAIDMSTALSGTLSWGAGNGETTASGWYEEHYAVYVVTNLATVLTGTFPTPVFEGTLTAGEVLETQSFDVSADVAGQATVYIVVRHFDCTDEFAILFDDVALNGDFTGTDESSLEVLSAFPNPTTDVLNINLNSNVETVSILSLDGKLISNEVVNANKVVLNVADLAAGVYFYEVVTAEGTKLRNKFIKK
jgi:hypothetical protein